MQHVQNSVTRRYDHVTPVLRSLHWLPVPARIDFKLLLVFKELNGLDLLYLSELLKTVYIPDRNLRSSNSELYQKAILKHGYRAFSHRAPTLWNALTGCQTILEKWNNLT